MSRCVKKKINTADSVQTGKKVVNLPPSDAECGSG